ncbi:NAD(P)/FAD-dependent oxidoreductase [Opitutaceae bacterium]
MLETMPNAASAKPHVVVLGAGFAGMAFCRSLPAGVARITVIDRQNHHLFQPLLYQVATAGIAAPDIAQPIRGILSDKPDLVVLMAEVTGIDLAARRVTHERGELTYDYLVLAVGGGTSYFGHPEWEEHAPGLKTLDDALRIRRRVLCAYEQAETEADPVRKAELMTTVIVGGGPTGVELAGALAELSRTVLRKDFDHIDPTTARILLIDSGDRVLKAFPPELSERATDQLIGLGVEVRTGIRVQDIRAGEVVLPDGVLKVGTIIWAAGVTASPLARTLGLETDRGGRLSVGPDLSLPSRPEVFAVGDVAAVTDRDGVEVPGVAQAALQMGQHVARIIASECAVRGEPGSAARPSFAYRDKGSMATIGRSAAVARIGSLQFSGWPAWVAWLGIHLLFLVGFRSKVSVLLSWMYSYFTYKRGARIITGGPSG